MPPIIERMEPFRSQPFEDLMELERRRRAGEVPTYYRLNHMGQKIEGLTKQDLINIARAIYENQQFLR